MNDDRTGLILKGSLEDKIADIYDLELQERTFGDDFGAITDLEIGPDGYLYGVSFASGTIFRTVPNN